MMGAREEIKVIPLVKAFCQQVTSAANDDCSNCWSAVRNNANNAWYVNTSNGNVNNNNTYNRYYLIPQPLASVELLFPMILKAESSCFKNKHHSLTACRVHYHLSELFAYTKDIIEHGLKVGRSKCFVLDYPVYREIFCAFYYDRIIHHMVAPLMTHVAEVMHRRSGDVSHGNRIGHSAFTAAVAVQKALRKVTNNWTQKAWVATRDYSGFFMSINRKQSADEFRRYAAQVVDVTEPVTAFLIDVVCHYLMADPTDGCIMLSPPSKMNKVAKNKSLRTSKPGHGLPIGNFPSQIIANLFRVAIDVFVNRMDDVENVVLVDDRMTCSAVLEKLKQALGETDAQSRQYGLTTNKRKCYMQPADRGVKFCGYVIKCDRIYISNRVVRACNRVIDEYNDKTDDESEAALMRSLNSYLGFMSHTRSWNIQKDIMQRTLSEHKTLFFFRRGGHMVCAQFEKHQPKYKSILNIRQFKNEIHRLQADAQSKRRRRSACRRVVNSSNQ